ncbi:MAG: hypothetical protein K2K08_06785 [Paramuribaculum sp.]|nr:hypothetical protein [Paramuribaculum sp.]
MRRLIVLFTTALFIVTALTANALTRSQIIRLLAQEKSFNVTYMTKAMLDKIAASKKDYPLAVLADNAGVNSVRVFEFGDQVTVDYGKALLNTYISGDKEADLMLLQQQEGYRYVAIYGLPAQEHICGTVLIFSEYYNHKTTLIIITGSISDDTVGKLIEAFDK